MSKATKTHGEVFGACFFATAKAAQQLFIQQTGLCRVVFIAHTTNNLYHVFSTDHDKKGHRRIIRLMVSKQ
jgi:hypothetical protein